MHTPHPFPCSFKHESSVFEPELFDIYLSYCQKSNSAASYKSRPSLPSGSTLGAYNISPGAYIINPVAASPAAHPVNVGYTAYQAFDAHSFWTPQPPDYPYPDPLLPITLPLIKPSGTMATNSHQGADGSNIPPGTTQVVSDKGSHTIYDFELQLLLDSLKKHSSVESNSASSRGSKSILDFPTYKHGSFLLYNQRGLLETLPLSYTCVSVTGNMTVLESNIYPLQHLSESQPPQGSGVGLFSKTSGYKYPSLSSSSVHPKHSTGTGTSSVPVRSTSFLSSSCPMPQILANISPAPKELMMQIESLKSGVAYSAVLKFVQPVLLTDISIPSTVSMSSVSVDVWLRPGEQRRRVAQSSEVRIRSLMLGMLSPPPLCQYVKVCVCVYVFLCMLRVY